VRAILWILGALALLVLGTAGWLVFALEALD
jgi:hypothetical protein